MLYYDRIDVPEGTYVNNTSKTKQYITCYYWYFFK